TVELGFPDLVMPQWYGLLGPAGLPPDIRQTIESQVLAVLRSDEVVTQLAASGVAGPKGAAEFGRMLDAEFRRWRELIPQLGMNAEGGVIRRHGQFILPNLNGGAWSLPRPAAEPGCFRRRQTSRIGKLPASWTMPGAVCHAYPPTSGPEDSMQFTEQD